MFVPLSDDNPLRAIRHAYVTVALIVLNVAAYLLEVSESGRVVMASFAIIPGEVMRAGFSGAAANGPYDAIPVPEALTLLTYMFLHGDPIHLGSNMLFLWVFGDNVEDALGHLRYLVFYLLCGAVGGLAHVLLTTVPEVPLIGASGAVAGVIAAYLLLHPHVRVWVLALRFIPLRITALWALGGWIAAQFAMLVVPNTGPIAWWAHIGGVIAGAALVVVLRRPGVALLQPAAQAPPPPTRAS